MRYTLDVRPSEAFRSLGTLVVENVRQIREAGQAGKFPVLSGLSGGTINYFQGEIDAWTPDTTSHWRNWRQVQAEGGGVCVGIACAVAAELICAGVEARPIAIPMGPNGMYHVIVQWRDAEGNEHEGDPCALSSEF